MNNQLTYLAEFRVLLDGKHVGTIKECYGESGPLPIRKPGTVTGYRYYPKGDKNGGDLYSSLLACQQSLEDVP